MSAVFYHEVTNAVFKPQITKRSSMLFIFRVRKVSILSLASVVALATDVLTLTFIDRG